jgi:hypothetical protein
MRGVISNTRKFGVDHRSPIPSIAANEHFVGLINSIPQIQKLSKLQHGSIISIADEQNPARNKA